MKKSGNYNNKVCRVAAERSPAAGERKWETSRASDSATRVLQNIRKAEIDKSGAIWVDKIEAAKYNPATGASSRTRRAGRTSSARSREDEATTQASL